jgi:hypothetical protein
MRHHAVDGRTSIVILAGSRISITPPAPRQGPLTFPTTIGQPKTRIAYCIMRVIIGCVPVDSVARGVSPFRAACAKPMNLEQDDDAKT